MSWNDAHENFEKYPDNPELQAAYAAYQDAVRTFNAQKKYCKFGGDSDHVNDALQHFIKTRKKFQ